MMVTGTATGIVTTAEVLQELLTDYSVTTIRTVLVNVMSTMVQRGQAVQLGRGEWMRRPDGNDYSFLDPKVEDPCEVLYSVVKKEKPGPERLLVLCEEHSVSPSRFIQWVSNKKK